MATSTKKFTSKSLSGLELARNLALIYGLNFSYQQICELIERYPNFTLRDLKWLRVHVTAIMPYLLHDLHDFAMDFACGDISGKKYFNLQFQLMNQMNTLNELI